MTDIFWENDDNDLQALDLFGSSPALPTLLDGFGMPPLQIPDPSPETVFPTDLLPPTMSPVNFPPKDEPASLSDDLISMPTPQADSSPVDGGSVDDEFFSERASSGNSSNHEVFPPTTSLSSSASDLTTGMSAVELAKRKAEQYANDKATDRKRKNSSKNGGNSKRHKRGTDGSSCSDGDEDDNDDAPEKVSHRKYQKRLQKNRDSAYVSRIRRREYARVLEESLEQTEKEKNDLARNYDDLKRKFDVAMQELKTLKELTQAGLKSFAKPIGAAALATTKPKKAGAIVTTMCMFALMFGIMLPDSLSSKAAHISNFNAAGTSPHFSSNSPAFGPHPISSAWMNNGDKGRVWGASGPPSHWQPSGNRRLLNALTSNVTQLFGEEHAGKVMKIMEQRLEAGVVSEKALMDIAREAQSLVNNLDEEDVQKVVQQSRKSAIFQTILRRLAAAADECFTKELVALLTVRLIPQPVKQTVRT